MSEGINQAAPAERSRAAIVAADGTRFEACLVPPRGGGGPALLILHGAAGLDASTVAWCKRFADEGYAVLAPDLSRHFDGHAFALTAALADVAAARSALGPHLEAGALRRGRIWRRRVSGIAARLAWRDRRVGGLRTSRRRRRRRRDRVSRDRTSRRQCLFVNARRVRAFRRRPCAPPRLFL